MTRSISARNGLAGAALLALCLLPFSGGCGDAEDDDSSSDEDTSTSAATDWYLGCGDPVCSGYSGPFSGVSVCTSEAVGDACSPEGQQCDPEDGCNALLMC